MLEVENVMLKEKRTHAVKLIFWVWAILNPVTLIGYLAVRRPDQVRFFPIAVFFFTFYSAAGLRFPPDYSGDGVRYIRDFYAGDVPLRQIIEIYINDILASFNFEIVTAIIYSLLSNISDDHGLLFPVFGFLFGGALALVVRTIPWAGVHYVKTNQMTLMLSLMLFFPFWMVNGFRYYMASIMFVYIVASSWRSGYCKRQILGVFTAMIHVSYLPFYLLFLATTRLPKLRKPIVLSMLILAAPIAVSFGPTVFLWIAKLAPGEIGYKAIVYFKLSSDEHDGGRLLNPIHFVSSLLPVLVLPFLRFRCDSDALEVAKFNERVRQVIFVTTVVIIFSGIQSISRFLLVPAALSVILVSQSAMQIRRNDLTLYAFLILFFSGLKASAFYIASFSEIVTPSVILGPIYLLVGDAF